MRKGRPKVQAYMIAPLTEEVALASRYNHPSSQLHCQWSVFPLNWLIHNR